jgi:hypothetical protein
MKFLTLDKKTNIIRGGINDSTKNSSDEKSNSSDI